MIDFDTVFTNLTGAWPNYEAKNVTAPGAGDGTEFVAALVTDIWGRAQALMDRGGLTPNGVQEAAGTAQIIEALSKGFGIGAGKGVIWWQNEAPSVTGDRVLLLQGQVIAIAGYTDLVTKTYVGDANNATAPAFYKTSDAGGTTRSTSGAYFVLPDTRECVLVGVGTRAAGVTAHDTYTKGQMKDDQKQGSRHVGGLSMTESAIGRYGNTNTGISGTATDYYTASTDARGYNTSGDIDDGTNGTPRVGTTTHGKQIGTDYGITY